MKAWLKGGLIGLGIILIYLLYRIPKIGLDKTLTSSSLIETIFYVAIFFVVGALGGFIFGRSKENQEYKRSHIIKTIIILFLIIGVLSIIITLLLLVLGTIQSEEATGFILGFFSFVVAAILGFLNWIIGRRKSKNQPQNLNQEVQK